jgi:hypothetical protein
MPNTILPRTCDRPCAGEITNEDRFRSETEAHGVGILADGTTYSHPGEFYFADRQVNQNTGAIQLTALFANPGNVLRHGQYGKVRAMIREQQNPTVSFVNY